MWFDKAQRKNLFSLAAGELNNHQARVKNQGSIFSCWDERFPDGMPSNLMPLENFSFSHGMFPHFSAEEGISILRICPWATPMAAVRSWGCMAIANPIHPWRLGYQWRRLEAELLTGSWNSSCVVNIPWRSAVCRYLKRAPSSDSNCWDNCSVSSLVAIPSK